MDLGILVSMQTSYLHFPYLCVLKMSDLPNIILPLTDRLKDKSRVDKIIVTKQLYQLLNTNHEFFPSFDASNNHKLVNKSS